MKTGQKVSWNSSGGTARGIIREIVRDGNVSGIPVKITGSKEEPAARIEIVDDEGKPTGTMVGHKLSTLRKAQYANDIFTTEAEAVSRSMDLGLDGVTHVSDYNGQAVFMPAESHEAYLAFYEQGEATEETEAPSVDRIEALRAIVAEVIGKKMINTNIEGKILKTDDEQRMVYGWASVVTEDGEAVVDRQGDVIEAATLVKAVNEFMEHVRVGKAMHTGEQVGTVVHSLPITKEIGDALGIQSNREGWVVAYKVFDDTVWDMVKSGELAAFSIGGRAMKEEI
tara:strand:- start:1347 stop:2195 length:849 start_codon:yes stop_codon:yes gene_type:complete